MFRPEGQGARHRMPSPAVGEQQRGLLRQHYEVPHKNHFDVILDLTDPGSRLFQSAISLATRQSPG